MKAMFRILCEYIGILQVSEVVCNKKMTFHIGLKQFTKGKRWKSSPLFEELSHKLE